MASTLTPERTPDRSLLAALPPLPFPLDVSAPVTIPTARRGADAVAWPYPIAGPSTAPEESLEGYIERRYYETLFLGELLSPLAGLVADLERTGVVHSDAICAVISQRLKGLSAIEARHRKVLAPVVAAILASGGSAAASAKVADASHAARMEESESNALNAAVELRARSRVVVEGEKPLLPRHITEELERREVLIQVVLLLIYRAHPHPPAPKKRKRRKDKPTESRPEDDTDAALELLADRISVWAAVAELGIGDAPPAAKKPHQTPETVPMQLKAFWDTALVPHFLPRETVFLTSFHAKVFGTPIPPELVPSKKPRKPKVTRKLDTESRDTTRARAEPPKPTRSLRRTESRVEPDRHSRSSSTNPPDPPPPRIIKRAASGGIKVREITFRRSNSMVQKTKQSQSQSLTASGSLSQIGLLGRNLQAVTRSAAVESQPRAQAPPSAPLIMATPVKRTHTIFARHQPTPIQEEPSSAGSHAPSYVAETPQASRTSIAETPLGIPFTPMQPLRFAAASPTADPPEFDDLMVPTDDEDDDPPNPIDSSLVPETP